jgi:hypothetical protein
MQTSDEFAALREKWSVDNLATQHTDVKFIASGIPYSAQFGLTSDHEVSQVSIADYMQFMKSLHGKGKNVGALPYIFSSLASEGLLQSSLGKTVAELVV